MTTYTGGDRVVVQESASICIGHTATVVSYRQPDIGDDTLIRLKCDCGRDLYFGKLSSIGDAFDADFTPFEIDVAAAAWRKFLNNV